MEIPKEIVNRIIDESKPQLKINYKYTDDNTANIKIQYGIIHYEFYIIKETANMYNLQYIINCIKAKDHKFLLRQRFLSMSIWLCDDFMLSIDTNIYGDDPNNEFVIDLKLCSNEDINKIVNMLQTIYDFMEK